VFWAIGDNTIDRFLDENETVLVGGNALNVAVQLARHGREVAYAGTIGDDADGALVASALRGQGVDTSAVTVQNGKTAVTDIRVTTTGDRVFEREEFGVTADYSPGEGVVDAASAGDWIHLGMVPDAASLVRRLRRVNPAARISQDCAVAEGFAGLDVAFVSAGEGEAGARDLAREAIAAGARLVVVTLGADGSLAHDGARWWRRAAVPIEPVDTTGAGDSYIAGFVSALASGGDVGAAMDAGSAWSAETCMHQGGWPQS
jgi:fructoselysine 6-kinase